MFPYIFLLVIVLCNPAFAGEDDKNKLVLSTPDQLAHQDRLVGRLVGPLGGQLILKQTDLVAKGAEPLSLDRCYIPPAILSSYDKKGGGADARLLVRDGLATYRGWVFMPHLWLQALPFLTFRTTDANGTTLDYRLIDGKTILLTEPHGISNYAGGTPSGQYDPRNVRIARENDRIFVKSPEGVTRTYRILSGYYQLEKEKLPNGKIRVYDVCDRGTGSLFVSVKSMDPKERHVYASIAMTGGPLTGACQFKTSAGQEATYHYVNLISTGKWEERHKPQSYNYGVPPLLTKVSRPQQAPETIAYSGRFQLDSYRTNDVACKCQYNAPGVTTPLSIQTLSLPVGQDDAFVDVHTLKYDGPVAKVSDGTTTVDNIDGTRVVYYYSKQFLPQKIAFYDANKNLVKQTLYQWTKDQRLESLTWSDGEGRLFQTV